MKRALRECAIFLVFIILSVVLTWPFARNVRTAMPDPGDPLLNAFIIDWDLYAFTHQPLHLFEAPIYAPALYPLAYSENLVAVALLMLPLHLFGAAPLTVYNVAFLLGFALAGYGASVLARVSGRSLFASMVAGVFFAFCPFKFDHLSHIQIIWSGWLPLMFAALFAYWRKPSTLRVVLVGAAFVMNGLTNIHWLLFGSFTLAATMLLLAIIEWGDWKRWAKLVATLAIGSAILLPFLLPYRMVSKAYDMKRIPEEVASYSATWHEWLYATPVSLLYGKIAPESDMAGERKLFPGAVPLFLAIAALLMIPPGTVLRPLARRRAPPALVRTFDVLIVVFALATYIGAIAKDFKVTILHERLVSIDNAATPAFYLLIAILFRLLLRMPRALGGPQKTLRDAFAESRFSAEEWAGLMWIAIGVIGSLGMNAVLHSFLYHHVEAFRGLRVPARWAIIAYLGLVIFTSAGVDLILRLRRGFRWSVAASLIAVAILLDVTTRVRWQQMVVAENPSYRWLRKAPVRGLVMELPTTGWWTPFLYVFGSTQHHVPIMNGTSGFEPPLHADLRAMSERGEFNEEFLSKLEKNRCELIVVHADWLGDERQPVMAWLAREMAAGRLAFVRRFDHWIEGDWVFAVTRASNDWQRFVPQIVPNGAGFTPDQEVARFLAGQPTYNTSTFFSIDTPRMDETYHGPLRVAGWALSPNGIARVRVSVNGGQRIYDTTPKSRLDVTSRWPWYPRTSEAGFEVVLPKRPKRMSRDVNVQIIVTDGAGKETRSIDLPITWD